MSAGVSRQRFTKVLAIAVGMLLLAWTFGPGLANWHRGQLAQKLSTQLEQADHTQAKIVLRQMVELGEPALSPMVAAAASPQAAVAVTARQILEERLAAWRLAVGNSEVVSDESVKKLVTLARSLRISINNFGPAGKQWAEQMVLELLDLAEVLSASEARAVLADCSQVLAAVPPRGPKLRTVARPTTARENAFEAPQPSLDSLSGASLESARGPTREEPRRAELEFQRQARPLPIASVEARKSALSNWAPAWKQRARQLATPQATIADGATKLSVEVAPTVSSEEAVDVPTPQEMKNRADSFRRLSSDELLQRLSDADFYEAGILRVVLSERGYDSKELLLWQRLASPNVADRLQLIEEVSVLPASAARRLFRSLLKDPNAEVRLRALTAMATTNDPQLSGLAREMAVSDEDPRVAKLASRLMRQAR